MSEGTDSETSASRRGCEKDRGEGGRGVVGATLGQRPEQKREHPSPGHTQQGPSPWGGNSLAVRAGGGSTPTHGEWGAGAGVPAGQSGALCICSPRDGSGGVAGLPQAGLWDATVRHSFPPHNQ